MSFCFFKQKTAYEMRISDWSSDVCSSDLLLTAMIGFCDLLLQRHAAGDPSFADIMQIKQNANRAANLVRQLLAFSRKQPLQPKIGRASCRERVCQYV